MNSGKMLSESAHVLDPARFALVSSPDERRTGRYRYRIDDARAPDVERDDFIIGTDTAPFVRLVLSAEQVGQELVLETGPARWSDVINSGTYGITMPLDPNAGPAVTNAGITLSPLQVQTPAVPFPPLDFTFPRTDVCGWVADALALLPGDNPKTLCGQERNFEVGSGVTVSVAGTIDSLLILGGRVTVTGNMDLGMTIDGGGITGGRAPKFAPCDRAAYLGCLTTPTGAALIDWLRQFAPAIPEASLPAVRICVPGTPVRVRAGYWDRSGFLPRWVAPVYERCRVSDTGELPTVVAPSFASALTHVRPHLLGSMILKVQGDGTVGLKIGIPYASLSAAYVVTDDFKAKASVGLFVELSATLLNGSAVILVTFDQAGVITQQWTDVAGWTGGVQPTKTDLNAQILAADIDSVLVRVGVPLEAKVEACLAIISCDTSSFRAGPALVSADALTDIAIGAEAFVAVSQFTETVWTRQEVGPEGSGIENWKLSTDGAYDFRIGAGIKIPFTGFILPSVPRSWADTTECCRVPLMDVWGEGTLDVRTSTTGPSPDPDGYQVEVVRADTLPRLIRSTVTNRLGPARDHGARLTASIAATDSIRFERAPGCAVAYSDAAVFAYPVYGLAVAGLRSGGVAVPSYGIPYPCKLLVARYVVRLTGVSDNCTVTGGAEREVWLESKDPLTGRDGITTVDFALQCDGAAPLGALTITTHASASPSTDRDYSISVDGAAQGAIGSSATRTLSALAAGLHTIALREGPSNCVGLDSVEVNVIAGETGTADFFPVCVLAETVPDPGDVLVSPITTGTGSDPDGFVVHLDGVARLGLLASESGTIAGVPPSTPSVIQVETSTNCRATTPMPFVITLDAAASPITVRPGLECTDLPIDSVAGTLERDANGGVVVRPDSGALVTVTGPAAVELAQLEGSPLLVWGNRRGTSLDTYGYRIRSSVADPRWVGIVTLRGAEVWLFGSTAIQLIDPPSALSANAGALVWVTGTAEGDAVRPRAYGLIRSVP